MRIAARVRTAAVPRVAWSLILGTLGDPGVRRGGGMDQGPHPFTPARARSHTEIRSSRVARAASGSRPATGYLCLPLASPDSCETRRVAMTDPGPTHPSSADRPFHLNFLWQAYDALATGVDHKLGWDHLPKLMGLFDLVGIRNVLREHNLHDTSRQPAVGAVEAPEWDPAFEKQRTVDGSWNDLANPTMGMAGTRFGRNVPIEHTWPDTDRLLEPNPRTVSRRLMTREELIPASAGNALIAAWLQFMIHDWFRHGTSPTDDPWVLELDPDDDWPEPPLQVFRTPPDPTSPPDSDLPPTYVNTNTHWWDGSQI